MSMKKLAADFQKLCQQAAEDGGPGSGRKGHTTPKHPGGPEGARKERLQAQAYFPTHTAAGGAPKAGGSPSAVSKLGRKPDTFSTFTPEGKKTQVTIPGGHKTPEWLKFKGERNPTTGREKMQAEREAKNLSPEAARNMKRDLRDPGQIARAYGVSRHTVSKIKGDRP